MVFGLKHYRQYLFGRKFVIRTALYYLMTAKELIRQHARWVDLMSEFDFTIQHRAGVSHTNADALSRKIPCELNGVDCRQCHKYIRDTLDTPNNLVCNTVRLEVPRGTPVKPRPHLNIIRAQPVRTRAQARLESEHTGIEASTPLPHVSTPTYIFEIELDHWMGTIRVQIGTSDIVHQQTQAIVNPANSHLNHFGGVACAIADGAGNNLISECERYKQTNGLLPTSSVIHTTAGRLRVRIEYVMHTVGPRDADYSDKDELQAVLTKTYYNVIKYLSETLRISTLALSAISSVYFM